MELVLSEGLWDAVLVDVSVLCEKDRDVGLFWTCVRDSSEEWLATGFARPVGSCDTVLADISVFFETERERGRGGSWREGLRLSLAELFKEEEGQRLEGCWGEGYMGFDR